MFILSILQMATMDFAEVHIDPRYHRHIIGKNGANGKLAMHAVITLCNL